MDLSVIAAAGAFTGCKFDAEAAFNTASLNAFMSMGKAAWSAARKRLQSLLREDGSSSESKLQLVELLESSLLDADSVTMHLPASIGDYTVSCALETCNAPSSGDSCCAS